MQGRDMRHHRSPVPDLRSEDLSDSPVARRGDGIALGTIVVLAALALAALAAAVWMLTVAGASAVSLAAIVGVFIVCLTLSALSSRDGSAN